MRTPRLIALIMPASFALAASVSATPAEDVIAAAAKLGNAPNFAWTVTIEIANSQFPAMPSKGVTEKGGYTVVTTEFNGNTRQTVRKGEQMVMQNRDGQWMTLDELRQQTTGGGRGGFMTMGGGGQLDFAKDAASLAGKLKNVKEVDGAITGTLTAEDAAPLLTFGRGGRSGQGGGQTPPPAPKNAAGNVKFWLKDGELVKYAVNAKGTITTPNGDEREIDLTTTTEIKDVGHTKVTVPDEAKKKFVD
ncbi:MAG TPA: hypothetical protein VM029_00830 [Opitutaceae bacterium]|nr:hypothetical protein [Opitutaceae bacterium]